MHDHQHDLSHDLQNDPVPPLAREILELYRGPLAEVRFPDLDRATLDAAHDELLDAQRALEAAERALEEARSLVAERTQSLQAKAQRGLAYARVFAEDQPELHERVAALATVPRRVEAPREDASAPKKRGRPRKAREGDGASLFAADAAGAEREDHLHEHLVESDAA